MMLFMVIEFQENTLIKQCGKNNYYWPITFINKKAFYYISSKNYFYKNIKKKKQSFSNI